MNISQNTYSALLFPTRSWHHNRTAYAVLMSCASLVVAHWIQPLTGGKYIFAPLLPAVLWAAHSWGIVPSIAAGMTGLMGVWYWIVPPHFSLKVHDRADVVGLVAYAAVCGFTIALMRFEEIRGRDGTTIDADAVQSVRLAMQGLLCGYCDAVCNCKGVQHQPDCGAHASSPTVLRAERSIRWMYGVEERLAEIQQGRSGF